MKKIKTLLAIGDLKDFEAFKKFVKQKNYFNNLPVSFKWATYNQLFKNKLPKITTKELIIFPFFPFEYWDSNIETKRYKGAYGNKEFFEKFNNFWKLFEDKMNHLFHKNIIFINHPKYLSNDRDKELTKQILQKAGLHVPKIIKERKLSKIKKLAKKQKLYIKVRYGSMGKGITFLSKEKWMTNFRFRKGKIFSKKSDYGWTFTDITKNNRFLSELLKQDIVIEPAIAPYIINNEKFDLRFYISFGKVRYIYTRTHKIDAVTTNISQGAKGRESWYLKQIPKKMLNQAKAAAVKAAKAMNLDVAGVDIMFNGRSKRPVIIEVNSFPGFPKSIEFNLSHRILDDIKRKFVVSGKIIIRKATRADFDEVLKLKLESKGHDSKIKKMLPVEKVREHYEYHVKRDIEGRYRTIFVAVLDDKIIGIVVGRVYSSLKTLDYERRASMSNLYIKKEYRGIGIANKLMNGFMGWCKDWKIKTITLSVYQSEKEVREMYFRAGFKIYCTNFFKDI